jgi:hypothetical protein
MQIIFYKKTDGALVGRRIAADTGANINPAQFWFDLFISDNKFDANEYGFLEMENIPENWDDHQRYLFDVATQTIMNNVNYTPPTVSTSTIPSTNTDTGQTT